VEGRRPLSQKFLSRSDQHHKLCLLLLLFLTLSPATMAMKQALLGHWKSPISSELITSKVRPLLLLCAGDACVCVSSAAAHAARPSCHMGQQQPLVHLSCACSPCTGQKS
jgi:hypothetical protein